VRRAPNAAPGSRRRNGCGGAGQLNADPEATKLVRDLDRGGMRTVSDRSLMVDDTPQ
jgi:hypothetical protein